MQGESDWREVRETDLMLGRELINGRFRQKGGMTGFGWEAAIANSDALVKISIMTATKMTAMDDGTPVLETFDFRSEFVFNDFASWVTETLDVRPVSGEIQDDMEPFSFEWNGSIFNAGWNDEHGCFISTTTERKDLLRQMQDALSS